MAAFSLTITGLHTDATAISTKVNDTTPLAAGRGVGADGDYPNTTDADGSKLVGLSLHAATVNGRVFVVISGKVYVSNTLTPGQTLVVVSTTGQLDYESNLASGERYLRIGYVEAANEVVIDVQNTEYQKP